MTPLLTVAVPTYNRGHLLPLFFERLWRAVAPCASLLEVLVSNNCSTDDTAHLLDDWLSRAPAGLRVRRFTQDRNVGAARNLTFLLKQASGDFFLVIGDDDQLFSDGLQQLLQVLQSEERPSAVVSSRAEYPLGGSIRGFVSPAQMTRHFFEFGCAPAGAFDRRVAMAAIENRHLWDSVESLVWPQTAAAYLAMHDARPRPAYVADFTIGGLLNDEWQTTPTREYWTRVLLDLLVAGDLVDRASGGAALRHDLLAPDTQGIHTLLQHVLCHSLAEDPVSSTRPLQHLLKARFGIRGRYWAWILRCSDSPKLYRRLFAWRWRLRHLGSDRGLQKALDRIRERYGVEEEARRVSGKRYGDWF